MADDEVKKDDVVRQLKWDELKVRVEHYRSHLQIALQATAFFYAITGGVLGFYLKDPPDPATAREYFLLLPILMGSVLGGVFIYGARLQEKAVDSMEDIRDELGDVKPLHDAHLLNILLRIFGNIFFVVAISLVGLPYLIGTHGPLVLFLGLAAIILLGGGLLPIAARMMDDRLKERRTRRKLKTDLKPWLTFPAFVKNDRFRYAVLVAPLVTATVSFLLSLLRGKGFSESLFTAAFLVLLVSFIGVVYCLMHLRNSSG